MGHLRPVELKRIWNGINRLIPLWNEGLIKLRQSVSDILPCQERKEPIPSLSVDYMNEWNGSEREILSILKKWELIKIKLWHLNQRANINKTQFVNLEIFKF